MSENSFWQGNIDGLLFDFLELKDFSNFMKKLLYFTVLIEFWFLEFFVHLLY